jgi:hypothetical protein
MRFLAPADYAATLKQMEVDLRALWNETPWSEK